MITEGRVTVNGQPARLGMRVDPGADEVRVDGVVVPTAPGLVHYLINKPRGVVSTASDPEGRRTVLDLVPVEPRVFPVGRLDLDSAGLLILTNDGTLTHALTHPSFEVTKTYRVLVAGVPGPDVLRQLTDGVELDDGLARAREVRLIDSRGDTAMLELVLAEGRNREIRRMFESLGFDVRELFRTAIGPLRDARLRSGEWRSLTLEEIRSLYEAAGV